MTSVLFVITAATGWTLEDGTVQAVWATNRVLRREGGSQRGFRREGVLRRRAALQDAGA